MEELACVNGLSFCRQMNLPPGPFRLDIILSHFVLEEVGKFVWSVLASPSPVLVLCKKFELTIFWHAPLCRAGL